MVRCSIEATQTRPTFGGRLIHEGDNHIRTVEKIQSGLRPLTAASGRQANDRLIARHLRGWKMKVAGWKASREAKAAREAAAREARLASARAFVPNTAAPAFVPSFGPEAPLPPPPLPKAFTAAAKWFGTAKGRGFTTSVETLEDLATEGARHLIALSNSRSSCPRGSRVTIARRYVKWKDLVNSWDLSSIDASLQLIDARRVRRRRPSGQMLCDMEDIRDVKRRLARAKKVHNEIASELEAQNLMWPVHRAKQRKKRTCSHCGTVALLFSRAFPYCGGCRHSAVPRVDRPRYCSEECQRAHWLAGHMNECPSCTG